MLWQQLKKKHKKNVAFLTKKSLFLQYVSNARTCQIK